MGTRPGARARGPRGGPRELAAAGDPVAAARTLGEQLHAHVRFEERELFATLERRLPADDLDRLGNAVADAERRL